MYASFLRTEDYQQMLKAQTLGDFEKVLRKVYPAAGGTARPGATQAANPGSPELEDRILGQFLDIVRKIQRSLPKQEAAFLSAIPTEYEIFNIKSILRGRMLGSSTQKIREELIPLGSLSKPDAEDLLAESEIPEILRMLRAHPLGARIEKAYSEEYLKAHNVYLLDARIDVEYLTWFYDGIKAFKGEEAGLLKKLIGERIDAINISWILRYKENFKMTPEEILIALVPRGYNLDLRALKELAFAEDTKTLLPRLRAYPWKKYLPADKLDLPLIEAGLSQYLKDQYYKIFRRNPITFAGVLAFVFLAKAVAQDATKILEATEYHLEKTAIEPQLFYLSKAQGS